MAELVFDCIDARTDTAAATPTILLRLRIAETTAARVYALALRCQIRIEPQRRRYSDDEADAVADLFGPRSQWGSSLKPFQLAFVSQLVPSFTGSIEVDLPLPCSYDFDVAAHKYLHALSDGTVPLLMLFSGSVFEHGAGGVSVQPVSWHSECSFRLPVEVWKSTLSLHFPGTAWLRLNTETFDALLRYRVRNQLLDWDDVVGTLLKVADRGDPG